MKPTTPLGSIPAPMLPTDTSGWNLYMLPDQSQHVVPCGDGTHHLLDDAGSCWCAPCYDPELRIFTHNSADGREDYERGTRLPH